MENELTIDQMVCNVKDREQKELKDALKRLFDVLRENGEISDDPQITVEVHFESDRPFVCYQKYLDEPLCVGINAVALTSQDEISLLADDENIDVDDLFCGELQNVTEYVIDHIEMVENGD